MNATFDEVEKEWKALEVGNTEGDRTFYEAHFHSSTPLLPFIGGIFVLEAISVILQVGSYKLRKKRIFKMAPLHHHFELMGWSESKVIVRFWIAALVFALFALTTLKLR